MFPVAGRQAVNNEFGLGIVAYDGLKYDRLRIDVHDKSRYLVDLVEILYSLEATVCIERDHWKADT